ncbi:MAG TPA: hypothetical protein VLZ81_13845 [Blastocatellia bacterium]|nr:hypothetical protein [Blastocatellia bacterium]
MFCPSCGAEERDRGRFCRGCGSELENIRRIVQQPDAITQSAVTARDEVGRAIADKLREIKSGRDFQKVVQQTLPVVQQFLESPEEKRLRQIREGITTAFSGLGIAILAFFLQAALKVEVASLIMVGAAALIFLIGVGIALAGSFFTVPRKSIAAPALRINNSEPALGPVTSSIDARKGIPPSVTENTTYNLEPVDRTTGPT